MQMNLLKLSILFIALVIFSWAMNFFLLKWSKTLGRKNEVNSSEIRWSDAYKPAIGGISFYFVFLISLIAYYFVSDQSGIDHNYQIGIIAAVSLGFFTGLADDAFNTVPWLKFAAQFLCGVILVYFNLRIEFFEIFWLDALLTIFWTISVMNSINMLDNMDGITASISATILISAAVCALPFGESALFYTIVCGGTVAALLGFLFLNWHPSRIFMGDTGSQMLGALLAAVGIAFFWNNGSIIDEHAWYSKIAIVLTAFVVPIGDSITVTINRLKRGQSPFVGGRDHTTHHLSYAGLSDHFVSFVLLLISCISIALIAGLQFVSHDHLQFYTSLLFAYPLLCISFLYSTTIWKKAKQVYAAKHPTTSHA